MTDIELTRLCAEAMGITGWLTDDDPMVTDESGGFVEPYDPLHDDAQAMALVKKFGLGIYSYRGEFWVRDYISSRFIDGSPRNGTKDLNRAIVECVAKMQKNK